jgi:hypothetical protein
MYTVYKQFLKQVPGNISPAGKYPAEEFILKSPVFQRFPVIRVRLGNDKVEYFPPVVDDGMQPETEKPSRRTFSPVGYPFECLMAVTDGVGKMIPAMYLNIPGIKGFQVSELFEVEENKNRDYFAVRHREFALPASFAAVFWEEVSLHYRVKNPAEFVN